MRPTIVRTVRAAAQPRPLGFVDAVSLPGIQDPQLSPDGTQALFVLDGPDWKANRRIGHIHRIGVDGRDQVQLIFGERGESSPRWSPDGSQIARVTEGAFSVMSFAIAPDGRRVVTARTPSPLLEVSYLSELWVSDGRGREARQLTADNRVVEGGVAIAPDNARLLFTAAADADGGVPQRQGVRDAVVGRRAAAGDAGRRDVRCREGRVVEGRIGDQSRRTSTCSPGPMR